MSPTPEQLYAEHKSGILVRESVGYIDPYATDAARRFARVRPYGWLRGFTLVADHPVPNMDASEPYTLTASLARRDGTELVACSFRVQQICEAVDGIDPFMGVLGEMPLL